MELENGRNIVRGVLILIFAAVAYWIDRVVGLALVVFMGLMILQSAFTDWCPADLLLIPMGLKKKGKDDVRYKIGSSFADSRLGDDPHPARRAESRPGRSGWNFRIGSWNHFAGTESRALHQQDANKWIYDHSRRGSVDIGRTDLASFIAGMGFPSRIAAPSHSTHCDRAISPDSAKAKTDQVTIEDPSSKQDGLCRPVWVNKDVISSILTAQSFGCKNIPTGRFLLTSPPTPLLKGEGN